MKINTNNAAFSFSAGRIAQFPQNGKPQIALSGRSNVGKSSLINCMLGRKSLARTSSSPGKTVTVNFYEIDGRLYFVDLPGYGYARRAAQDQAQWSALTDGYFTKNPARGQPCLVVQLIDIRVGATADDRTMIDYLLQTGTPFVIAASKTDKLSKTAAAQALERLRNEIPNGADLPIVPFSSVTGEGKAELWKLFFHHLEQKQEN